MNRKKRRLPVVGVVSDMGHSLLKLAALVDGEWSYDVIPHALHTMQSQQWEVVIQRGGSQSSALDFIQVGQDYYIMGDSAERYGHSTRAMGASRYRRDYIGVQMIAMLARVCPYPEAELVIMALHPPGDAQYTRDLRRALNGTWDIRLGNGDERKYHVRQTLTVDEPVGGLFNLAITSRGKENIGITSGETLVLDIGGGTTSVAPVLPGGSVDYARIKSYSMGILDVTTALETNLRNHYHEFLRRTRKIPQGRLRDSLVTHQFQGGGRVLNCAEDVRAAKGDLLREIEQMYYNGSVGGPVPFDTVILTGGGPVPMGDELRDLLDHKNIQYAAPHEQMHLANMHGGIKMFAELMNEGSLEL